MIRKRLVWVALVATVGLLIWANVRKLDSSPTLGGTAPATAGKGQIEGPAGAPLVKVQEASRRGLTQTVVAPGLVEASGVHELRAPFSTLKVRLLAGLGERVRAGQLLAELDADELRTQIIAQEAQVARAESQLAALRLEQAQAPLQLAQRLEQARVQLLQAEEGLAGAATQTDSLTRRLEQARAGLELVQSRIAAGAAQVDSARQALVRAEDAYRANPDDPGLREADAAARTAYEEALRQSRAAAEQTAADLERAYDELEAAEQEYAQSGGEDPAALQLAAAQVESARLTLRMAEVAAEFGGNVAGQVRAAEADLAVARANLADLKQKLEDARVTAPAAGTILTLGLKDGQPVQQGQIMLTLGNLETVAVLARVDEIDVGKVLPGQSLTVRSNAHPTTRFSGQVTRVAAESAAGGGAVGTYFEVQGEVTNAGTLLRSGMNVEVSIVAGTRENTFVVGLAAVREDGDQAQLLVVEDFKVTFRPVTLGLRTGTEAEVLEGLREGDRFIVSPFTLINSLKAGDTVRYEVVEPDAGVDAP